MNMQKALYPRDDIHNQIKEIEEDKILIVLRNTKIHQYKDSRKKNLA